MTSSFGKSLFEGTLLSLVFEGIFRGKPFWEFPYLDTYPYYAVCACVKTVMRPPLARTQGAKREPVNLFDAFRTTCKSAKCPMFFSWGIVPQLGDPGIFARFFFPEALRRVLLLKAAANFTCQLLMPTCRELLHLPTSHVNFLRVTPPANFSCQLFGCYLILLKAQANLSGATSLPKNTS